MALTGTWTALTDKKFKILKKTVDVDGSFLRLRHAYFMDNSFMPAQIVGGHKYQLSAENLATVS